MLLLVLVCVFTQHSDASTSSNNGTTAVDSTLEEYWESVADNEQVQLDVISRLIAHLLTSRDVTDVNAYWRFRSRKTLTDLQAAIDANGQSLSAIRNDVTSLQGSRSSERAIIARARATVVRSTYVRWGRTECAGNSTLLYEGKAVLFI